MGEPDSWEDMEEGSQQAAGAAAGGVGVAKSNLKLNANAPSFTFNPSVRSWSPSGTLTTPSTPAFGQSYIAAIGAAPALEIEKTKMAPGALATPIHVESGSIPASVPSPVAVEEEEEALGSTVAVSDSVEALADSRESGSGAVESGPESVEEDGIEGEVNNESKKAERALGEELTTSEETVVGHHDDTNGAQVNDTTSSLASLDVKDTDLKELEELHEQESRSKPAEVLDEETDKRQHLNVVFIGHVDAGKSTIGGQILYLSDMVDERTIQKYEREAKEKNRESWYMAYIMDTNEEERAKGKTVEVGRAHFETEKSRFTILDAPGHKNYVPNMISGASQADVGVLVISARKGEFETGFERGGQTREHAQLAKTLGVSKLLVVVNKMDDPSVLWTKERFDEIEKKMVPFLKSCGYNVKKDVQFLPISGLMGINMRERMNGQVCLWWDGPCLFEALDAVELPARDPSGPFRMPLIDKFKDMGTVVMGKIESGSVRRGDNLVLMPNKALVKVVTVYRDNAEVNYAKPGENLRIRIAGVEEEDISSGFVLSSVHRPIPAVLEFDAQLQILELLDHKAIFTAGYKAVLHIHSVVEECEIIELLQQIDPKTKKPMKKKLLFVKSGAIVVVRIQVYELICVEKFEDFPQLGRFTLRDEGKTVAIGKVVKLPTTLSGQE